MEFMTLEYPFYRSDILLITAGAGSGGLHAKLCNTNLVDSVNATLPQNYRNSLRNTNDINRIRSN